MALLDDRELVQEKYIELNVKGGIILLEYLDDERIENIVSIAHSFFRMNLLVIEDEQNKAVVLWLKYKCGNVNYREVLQSSSLAYREGNYDKCIRINLLLLQRFDKPKPFIFANLGLAYWKKGELEEAIKYLKAATIYSKMLGQDKDFTPLISKIQRLLDSEGFKPEFHVGLSEFVSRSDDEHFGIDNFCEINAHIRDSKLSVEEACQQLGMSESQIALVELIYAREFYRQGNIARGDLFLKAAQKHKNKTPDVISNITEISKNKRFYQNGEDDKPRQFVLDFYPRVK